MTETPMEQTVTAADRVRASGYVGQPSNIEALALEFATIRAEALSSRAPQAGREGLRELLQECADDLAAEIEARFEAVKRHPAMERQYERDMDPVRRARLFLESKPVPTPADEPKGDGLPLWRHKKRGSTYREIGRGFAQVAAHPIEEMTAVVIYQGSDGGYWVRNAVEFDDGRFEYIGKEDEPKGDVRGALPITDEMIQAFVKASDSNGYGAEKGSFLWESTERGLKAALALSTPSQDEGEALHVSDEAHVLIAKNIVENNAEHIAVAALNGLVREITFALSAAHAAGKKEARPAEGELRRALEESEKWMRDEADQCLKAEDVYKAKGDLRLADNMQGRAVGYAASAAKVREALSRSPEGKE